MGQQSMYNLRIGRLHIPVAIKSLYRCLRNLSLNEMTTCCGPRLDLQSRALPTCVFLDESPAVIK